MEWYIRHGCREVLGVRFVPLRISQSVTDKDQVQFINLFQGFRCHDWISNSLDRCRRLYLMDSARSSSLEFFLQHVQNICGGDPEAAKLRHGWNALTCFYADLRLSMWIINQGPPGCGKSSADEKFAEYMLNKAHFRKVTAIEHLVGHFNADAERVVFTMIEEMDFKDAKSRAVQALQELVTCKELRGEAKGVDAKMRPSYDHFVAETNAESPIILPKDQRRVMINVFSRAVALKMANDKAFKEAYLDRLARVLDDEDMWRSYAYYLYTEYTPTYERAMEVLRSMQVRRVFNWHTTRTQLASMIFFADTSVLGWLFWSVSRHEPFTAGPAKAFV
jgi:hypothetical protein